MINTQFHTLKEKHIASLNVLLQTVKGNSEFSLRTRAEFEYDCRSAIECIFAQRREVYLRTEKFSFTDQYDPETLRYASAKRMEIKPGATRAAHSKIMQVISEVAAETKKIRIGDSITNPMTNDSYRVEEEFHQSNKYLEGCFEKMINAIKDEDRQDTVNETKPEEKVKDDMVDQGKTNMIQHTLTEDDFDENPDLNKAGLNVGDTIEIPAPEEAVPQTPEVKEAEPQAPPAVIPTSEIEAQNAQETVTPRKKGRGKAKKS